jgi:hypothetical protein
MLLGVQISDKSSGDKDKDTAVPFKKVEESIAFGLKLLQKCLRGAAEVLGDDLSPGALLSLPAVPISRTVTAMDVDSAEATEDGSYTSLVIHTARDQILCSIHSKEDKQLYASLRYAVLEFLVFCNDSLQALSPAAGAAAGTGSTFSGLYDSYIIQVSLRALHSFRALESLVTHLMGRFSPISRHVQPLRIAPEV